MGFEGLLPVLLNPTAKREKEKRHQREFCYGVGSKFFVKSVIDQRRNSCVARSVLKQRDSEMIRNCRKCETSMEVKVLEQRMGPRPCGLTALVLLEIARLAI